MNKELKQTLGGALLFAGGMAVGDGSPLQLPLYLLAYLATGWNVLYKALKNLFRGRVFGENFLMSIATIGAFAIREYPEAVAVMLFYQIGEALQDYAVDRSRKSIADLMGIRPDSANRKTPEGFEKADPGTIGAGEILLILAGERVPLDCEVLKGTSTLDTSALTGETLPRKVGPGSLLLSGSVNKGGLLEARVLREYGESTVSRILDLVENASARKSVREQFITRFAKVYTPVVVGLGALLALAPPLLIPGQSFDVWIYRSLAFLVVSCPCALVVSIPLSFFAGIGGASKAGILFKGGAVLEALADAGTVVYDKTGTLTEGVFEVRDIIPSPGFEREEIMELAAYAEAWSAHPIAESIRNAYGREVDRSRIGSVQEVSGQGIEAVVDGRKILAGNAALMERHGIPRCAGAPFGTLVQIAVEGRCAGTILIADKLREDAGEAVEGLKKAGIRKVLMLTGDAPEAAAYVAETLGLDGWKAGLLPQDKVKEVRELMEREPGAVAFVGDGINDAPVLALSDVGIAMGGLGRDAAIEAADVVIMEDHPSKTVQAIALARKTVRIARANVVLAIGIKTLVLAASAAGLASLWAAVFADVGVTVLAVFNALRALKPDGMKGMLKKNTEKKEGIPA